MQEIIEDFIYFIGICILITIFSAPKSKNDTIHALPTLVASFATSSDTERERQRKSTTYEKQEKETRRP